MPRSSDLRSDVSVHTTLYVITFARSHLNGHVWQCLSNAHARGLRAARGHTTTCADLTPPAAERCHTPAPQNPNSEEKLVFALDERTKIRKSSTTPVSNLFCCLMLDTTQWQWHAWCPSLYPRHRTGTACQRARPVPRTRRSCVLVCSAIGIAWLQARL